MRPLGFIHILLVSLVGWAQVPDLPGTFTSEKYTFRLNSEDFVAEIISYSAQAPRDGGALQESRRLEALAKEQRDEAFAEFAKHFPHYQQSYWDELKAEDRIDDVHNKRIIVKSKTTGQTVGTLQMVYDDYRRPLPVEKHLREKLPRPTSEDPVAWSVLNKIDGQFFPVLAQTAGYIQLMQFIGRRRHMTGFLIYLSELALSSDRRVSLQSPGADPQNEIRTYHADGRLESYDSAYDLYYPKSFILYCGKEQEKYYTELGFKKIKEEKSVLVFEMAREDYRRIFEVSFIYKAGLRKMQENGGLEFVIPAELASPKLDSLVILPGVLPDGIKPADSQRNLEAYLRALRREDDHRFERLFPRRTCRELFAGRR